MYVSLKGASEQRHGRATLKRGATPAGRTLHRRLLGGALGPSQEETLRRLHAMPELAHLTMENLGVIHQLAWGRSWSELLYQPETLWTCYATCYDYPDNLHSLTFLTFAIHFWHPKTALEFILIIMHFYYSRFFPEWLSWINNVASRTTILTYAKRFTSKLWHRYPEHYRWQVRLSPQMLTGFAIFNLKKERIITYNKLAC